MRVDTIILASGSPRRRELLKRLFTEFEPASSDIDESPRDGESPRIHAERLAVEKAAKVSARNSLIIAADTIVVIDNEVLGKPESAAHASIMLKRLSGKTHTVITAFCLMHEAEKILKVRSVESKVTFRAMSGKEISAYIATGEPLDKAGSYGAQGIGKNFISRIEGSLTNVIGLPMEALEEEILKIGILPDAAKTKT